MYMYVHVYMHAVTCTMYLNFHSFAYFVWPETQRHIISFVNQTAQYCKLTLVFIKTGSPEIPQFSGTFSAIVCIVIVLETSYH